MDRYEFIRIENYLFSSLPLYIRYNCAESPIMISSHRVHDALTILSYVYELVCKINEIFCSLLRYLQFFVLQIINCIEAVDPCADFKRLKSTITFHTNEMSSLISTIMQFRRLNLI